jgi:formylglycine-generating enzyme required for sulfatase activity
VVRGTIGVLLLPQLFKEFGKSKDPISSSLPSESPRQESTAKSPIIQPRLTTIEFASVKVNDKGDIIARPQGQSQIYKEDLGDGAILTMVKIPAGSFLMGSPESEKGRFEDESPQHPVSLKEFYMGQTEVTQSQYQAIMGENPSKFRGNNLPVETVSWNQSQEFCQKLSTKTGRNYTLPSESQWEYACRAGTTTPFYFGETITPDLGNYDGNSTYGNASKGSYRKKTTKVGEFPPNDFGLYDMYGNVWEWCQDTWHKNYQDAPMDGSALTSRNNNAHILRGGSWISLPRYCRSATREDYTPDNRLYLIGVRVVCETPRIL